MENLLHDFPYSKINFDASKFHLTKIKKVDEDFNNAINFCTGRRKKLSVIKNKRVPDRSLKIDLRQRYYRQQVLTENGRKLLSVAALSHPLTEVVGLEAIETCQVLFYYFN